MKIRMLVGEHTGEVVEMDDESADSIVMRGKGMYLDSEGEESQNIDDDIDDSKDLPETE